MKLPSQIASEESILDQFQLARYGRRLSELEDLAGKYLSSLQPRSSFDALSEILPAEILNTRGEGAAAKLCAEFLRIVRDGEWTVLERLAKSGPHLAEDSQDPIRAGILVWKLSSILGAARPSPLRDIQKAVGHTGDIRVFRRMVDELQCPYKKLRGGRPRKTGTVDKKIGR